MIIFTNKIKKKYFSLKTNLIILIQLHLLQTKKKQKINLNEEHN